MPLHRRRSPIPLFALLLALSWAPGCTAAKTNTASSPDRSTLTAEQLAELRVDNAYDAILALRSNWLQERGPDSFSNPSKVMVFLDNVELGLVETLKTVPIRTITRIRHLDGVEANARYGVGHGAGAIVITTYPSQETRPDPPSAAVVQEGAPFGRLADAGAPSDGFQLASGGAVVPIYLAANELPGVVRAARDLRTDLQKVTGATPRFGTGAVAPTRRALLAGTLGHSALIDGLVRAGKLDTSRVAGRWETFARQVVRDPLPGVTEALVIVGSDKRGTIYGIYDLSKQIGVSPWYWWADVPVPHRADLVVDAARRTLGEPAVKYRGIFINDEAPAFSGWAREKYGGANHLVYEKVFELILRLRGNYLWPAMWGNAFADDDSLSARLADEYGIVMGTSHHEPMTRAQQEWKRYGTGAWSYEQNDSTLREFWRQGIRRMDGRENIVTVGMRGDGDMPMTQGSNVALLERIVADQRTIIGQVTGRSPEHTPQLWALYKEVQDYYDKGMRVPDDVTLLFADDNWGNVRRLPQLGTPPRSGGAGVYYHFDYVGGPRNYKWINTNPIARVWEQMHLAHAYGADRIWIVNVGDIKPMEMPIEFFLDYAWRPDSIPAEGLPTWTQEWSARQFGSEHAAEIAGVISRTLRYAGRRKPELLAPETYSLANYREAEQVVADYAALRADAERVGERLGTSYRDAYYQLVLHPVLAAANLDELYMTAARNRLYALQGRATTNALADSARLLFDRDAAISLHYNRELAGGKWNHMMDQTHIGYTYWQEPPRNLMPRVDVIQVPPIAEMGVAVEGQERTPFGPPHPLALPPMDSFQRQHFAVDLYDRGSAPFAYRVAASAPWILVSPASGTVSGDRRLDVSVDWDRVPLGTRRGTLSITSPGQRPVTIEVPVANHGAAARDALVGFTEGNGVVAMEAEHYTSAVATGGVRWQRIPDFGRTLSGMTPFPVSAPSRTPGGDAPHLEYRLTMFDSGTVTVRSYLSPVFNVNARAEGMRFAVSFDDEMPQVVNVTADTTLKAWEQSVSDGIVVPATHHELARAGVHVLKYWMVDPGVVLQRLVVDAGGMRPSYLGPPESFYAPAPRAAAAQSGSANVAHFDWFDYSGHDSVYRANPPKRGAYANPVVAGFYPDPSAIRVGDDYYLVASSFSYFPGVPIFHSRDLTHWTQIGSVLDRPSQLPVQGRQISEGIFAPTLRHHAGTFYLITTCGGCGGNFIVTATNAAGPWSDPLWLPEVDGIDPSLFFDDDGRAWVINNGPPVGTPRYQGHRALWIQEYDVSARRMKGPRTVVLDGGVDTTRNPIWIEAPHIFRHLGRYYLIAAEGGTADQHSEVVLRADSLPGPWTQGPANPILTQRHLPVPQQAVTAAGHADFVQTPRGDWWAVFLGARPYAADTYNTGRETFLLPVSWHDGWPTVDGATGPIAFTHSAPALRPDAAPTVPTWGNFTVRDQFDEGTLPRYWTFLRAPGASWYDLTSRRGWLTIHPRTDDLNSRGTPSFVARRQQHTSASASTAVQFAPASEGDRAGLAVFQNETHNYCLCIAMEQGRREVRLERSSAQAGGAAEVLASAPLTGGGDQVVYLEVDARGARYDFSYALQPGRWIVLARDVDGRFLSTKAAGGFVGTMIGPYARSGVP